MIFSMSSSGYILLTVPWNLLLLLFCNIIRSYNVIIYLLKLYCPLILLNIINI